MEYTHYWLIKNNTLFTVKSFLHLCSTTQVNKWKNCFVSDLLVATNTQTWLSTDGLGSVSVLCLTGKHGFKCRLMFHVLSLQVCHTFLSALRDYIGTMSTDYHLDVFQIWAEVLVCVWLPRLGPSMFSYMFSALSPRLTAPPQTLINHRTHWVTFALLKKILQTLAFRKYNYLPFHISAANILALWAVYLMVFGYRLTFLLYFHSHQIEITVCVNQSVERETSDVLSMMLILKSWQQ